MHAVREKSLLGRRKFPSRVREKSLLGRGKIPSRVREKSLTTGRDWGKKSENHVHPCILSNKKSFFGNNNSNSPSSNHRNNIKNTLYDKMLSSVAKI